MNKILYTNKEDRIMNNTACTKKNWPVKTIAAYRRDCLKFPYSKKVEPVKTIAANREDYPKSPHRKEIKPDNFVPYNVGAYDKIRYERLEGYRAGGLMHVGGEETITLINFYANDMLGALKSDHLKRFDRKWNPNGNIAPRYIIEDGILINGMVFVKERYGSLASGKTLLFLVDILYGELCELGCSLSCTAEYGIFFGKKIKPGYFELIKQPKNPKGEVH